MLGVDADKMAGRDWNMNGVDATDDGEDEMKRDGKP
jgi:hypothetical protein